MVCLSLYQKKSAIACSRVEEGEQGIGYFTTLSLQLFTLPHL